jgi:hypothetical protein
MILSVGEPVVGVSETTDMALAQGFLGGSKSIIATPSGIDDIESPTANVYPNPFSKSIKIISDLDNIHVSVYNTLGQEVYNGIYERSGLDLSYLSPGIYMVHAMANEQTISNTKLLKQ